MSWQISGSRADLVMQVSESGAPSWRGNGVHTCSVPSIEYKGTVEQHEILEANPECGGLVDHRRDG